MQKILHYIINTAQVRFTLGILKNVNTTTILIIIIAYSHNCTTLQSKAYNCNC